MFVSTVRQSLADDKHSEVFSSNATGCGRAEGPLCPDEKSDTAKYDDDGRKKEHHCVGLSN